jgi:hypothetical protein
METLRLETLRRKIESDEPEGCPACGAIAGACSEYPNCPGATMSYSFSVKAATKAEAIKLANPGINPNQWCGEFKIGMKQVGKPEAPKA